MVFVLDANEWVQNGPSHLHSRERAVQAIRIPEVQQTQGAELELGRAAVGRRRLGRFGSLGCLKVHFDDVCTLL